MSTTPAAAAAAKHVFAQGTNPGLRYQPPYYFTYKTFAKERWHGRELLEVVSTEFRDRSVDYYRHAIDAGVTTINGKPAHATTVIKNGDALQNVVHRHEPPVSAHPIQIIHVDPAGQFIVIDKPGGTPVHPTGRYYKNSCVEILESPEFGFDRIYTVNRLDRLTSGLMFFALNGKTANAIQKDFQAGLVGKTYLARVRGKFPDGLVTVDQPLLTKSSLFTERGLSPPSPSRGLLTVDEPLLTIDRASGLVIVHPEGKEAKTTFQSLFYDEKRDESVVECKPYTGRTHQIRVHLQYLGHPIPNDPVYSGDAIWSASPTLGKGGVDVVAVENPLLQKEYGPSLSTEEREKMEREAKEALAKYKPIDASKSEEAMKREVEEVRKLMPREIGTDVGMSSPVLLSEEAREIIRRLRRMKDASEDWARWKDVVLYTQEAAKSPAITESLSAHFKAHQHVFDDLHKSHSRAGPLSENGGKKMKAQPVKGGKMVKGEFVHHPPKERPSSGSSSSPKEKTGPLPGPPSTLQHPLSSTSAPKQTPKPDPAFFPPTPSSPPPSDSTSPSNSFIPPAGFCPVCYIPLAPDPDPDRLFIYLHAVRYAMPYGEYETGLPVWAREDWDGDDGWEGRAKGQGVGGAVGREDGEGEEGEGEEMAGETKDLVEEVKGLTGEEATVGGGAVVI